MPRKGNVVVRRQVFGIREIPMAQASIEALPRRHRVTRRPSACLHADISVLRTVHARRCRAGSNSSTDVPVRRIGLVVAVIGGCLRTESSVSLRSFTENPGKLDLKPIVIDAHEVRLKAHRPTQKSDRRGWMNPLSRTITRAIHENRVSQFRGEVPRNSDRQLLNCAFCSIVNA